MFTTVGVPRDDRQGACTGKNKRTPADVTWISGPIPPRTKTDSRAVTGVAPGRVWTTMTPRPKSTPIQAKGLLLISLLPQ